MASSYRSDLPRDETGMIAQWNFDNLSSNGVVTESVSGNNLTVKHTSQSGFTASDPELIFAVNENAVDGTVIGAVNGFDIDREARITQLLAADSTLRYSAETGKFYKLNLASTTWANSLSTATGTTLGGVNGQLVTIGSASEDALVYTFVQQINKFVWLGGSDSVVEGEWRWYDGPNPGTTFYRGASTGYAVEGAYTNFESNEPNDFGGNEDHLIMSLLDGRWNDNAQTSNRASIIQWNADAVLDSTNALTYSINSQTVAGAFAINASTGRITVADGSALDYETNATHTLTVRVSDGTSTREEDFTVSLNNLVEDNNAPTDLSSGIELNTDGGNDGYLILNDATPLMNQITTGLTLETTFQIETGTNRNTLLSYANVNHQDEINFNITATGRMALSIRGVAIASDVHAELLDGDVHRVAVSWDSTNGDVSFYLDGKLVSTATGLQQGVLIGSGGALVLGHDQDSVAGGFQSDQGFKGTLYDVRIWNEVRSEPEISLNHQSKFDSGSLPDGLIANWQMNGFNGSNQVVDVVTGNNLSIGHATGAGFIASTPVDDLHISENAGFGATVGFVVPTDPDVSNDITRDGLFTNAAAPPASPGYSSFLNGSALGDWTVTQGSAWLLGDYYAATPAGGRSVELHALNNAGVSQTLSTEAGRQYQIIFAISGDWPGADEAAVQQLRVSADGQSSDFAVTEPIGWSRTNPLWQNRSMTFTADDSTATLDFRSISEGTSAFNVVFGDVRVLEISATVTTILNNDPTLQYDAATDKFYRYVNTQQTWTSALANATSSSLNGVSGELVRIESAYENELIRSMNVDPYGVFLGGSDTLVEGQFRWYDGDQPGDLLWSGNGAGGSQNGIYNNFSSAGPDDFGPGQDYLAQVSGSGVWDDASNGQQSHSIIQWDASEVLSNFTFSLTDNAGGRFAINSNTGEITIANGSLIDYETATSHDVTVRVTDAAGNSYAEAMAISVTNVSEAPSGTDNTVTTLEDTNYTFTAADFGFSDVDGDSFDRVFINTLPANGLLLYNGATFTSGNFIAKADLDLGALTFAPAAHGNGNAYTNFTFSVADDGGTANGGQDSDASPNSLTINVTPVNDAPTISTGFDEFVGDFGGSTSRTDIGKATYGSSNLIAVDADQLYDLSVTAFSGDGAGGNYDPSEHHFLGFFSFDIDGLQITASHTGKMAGAVDTTLAVDLVAGATQIVLTDATGWFEGSNAGNRSLAWYGYTNSLGETYADYTYTRNLASNLWDENAIDHTTNTITLRSAWTGPTILAGDAVRNMSPNGGTYQYPLAGAAQIDEAGGTFTATIGGGVDSGSTSPTLFRHGTAFISPLVLANFTNTGNQLTVSDFTVQTQQGTTVFIEDGGPIAISDGDFAITDPDEAFAESVTITLTNGRIGDIFNVNESAINALGISVSGVPTGNLTADGSITLTLTSNTPNSVTFQDYKDAIATITFDSDSENPDSSDRTITFVVNDGELDSATENLVVKVHRVNDAPVITSDGGGATASISINETVSLVTTVTASDVDLPAQTITYSLGGVDASRFTIDASGNLTFSTPPDFENPTDNGGNNVYEVIVIASDGLLSDSQAISVTVLDVSATSLIVTTTADTNDTGLGASFTIEQLNARGGGVDGHISLREAVIAANSTLGADTITFDIGTGVQTITLGSLLPQITDVVTLDGSCAGRLHVFAVDLCEWRIFVRDRIGLHRRCSRQHGQCHGCGRIHEPRNSDRG